MSSVLSKVMSTGEVWVGAIGLAAFLTVFWVLRGAPIGQAVTAEEDQDAPRGGYRDRVVTGVSLGLLLILAGAYLAMTRGVAWSLPAFVLGFGTVLALVTINQRYRHGSPSLRRTVDISSTALNAALFAGILIVINVLAFRYGGRALDMTREGAFSLSTLTINQLKTLNRPVTFTTFFGKGGVAVQQRDRVEQMLELYKAANPEKVRLDHVDPFRDLPRYEDLVRRVPDVDITQGGGLVIEYGEGDSAERSVVRNNDLFEVPRSSRFDPDAESFESIFKGEDAVTTALIRMREGKRQKIVFTVGHGEPSVDDMESTRSALGLWKSRLNATGIDVFSINLLSQDLPEDSALIVVAGPKTPFKPEEVNRLKAFSDRKGPVLVLLGDVPTTGLEGFLLGFGVQTGRGFAIEPRLNFRNRPDALLVQVANSTQPIVEPLLNQIIFMLRAAPLKVVSSPDNASSNFLPTILLRTSPESWAEPELSTRRAVKDQGDEVGPLTVALAVNDRPKPGESAPGVPRLVVIGSRYVGDNALVSTFPANLDLLMNAVNWLRGREELKGISPTTHRALTLTADPVLKSRLILTPTVMATLLIASLGAATYLARRE